MLNKIADFFIETAAQMAANQFQQGLLGMFGAGFGGLGNNMMGGPKGGYFDPVTGKGIAGPNFGLADGGTARRGSSYLVGERGPELFTPGVTGTVTPNHALGGSVNVSVNVDASGTSVEGNEPNAEQLGRLIGAVVQSELIKEKRPGGLLG